MLITEFERKDGESEQSYLWRLGQAKDSGLLDAEWSEIADKLNKEYQTEEDYKTESAYRRAFQSARLFWNNCFSKMDTAVTADDIDEQYRELRRERARLRDERTDYNRKIREEARLDQKLDRLSESLQEFGRTNFCVKVESKESGDAAVTDKEMIVMLSDLHIGSRFYSFQGMYDPDIALDRISKYADRVKQIQKQSGAEICQLALLGDLIDGAIHAAQRIENSDNVIEQVKIAAQLTANFITQMSTAFKVVEIHHVTGNHSRIEAKKDDCLRDERLDNLVCWCAEQMVSHLSNVTFIDPIDSTFDEMIACGQTIVLTHGDFDDFTDAGIGKLCFMCRSVPSVVISAHRHYSEFSEVNGIKVVRSGCLCGSGGDYTMRKRLTGEASQAVLVMSAGGIEGFYPVELE